MSTWWVTLRNPDLDDEHDLHYAQIEDAVDQADAEAKAVARLTYTDEETGAKSGWTEVVESVQEAES